MLIHYLKITWKVLMRNKLFTFISLFGISLTLTILLTGTALYNFLFYPTYPETHQNRILFVSRIDLATEDRGSRYKGEPSYYFLNKYVRSLKTPQTVSIFSSGYNKFSYYSDSYKYELDLKYTDAEFWQLLRFDFIAGRPYRENEVKEAQQVAVISESLAKECFGSTKGALGKTIDVDKNACIIVGIIRDVSKSNMNVYGNIWVPLTLSKVGLSYKVFYGDFAAMIMAKKRSDLAKIEKEFQSSLSKIEWPVDDYHFVDCHATSALGQFALARPIGSPRLLNALLFTISFIIILIPSINLVNLNVNRISERQSEIGIRKTFGADNLSLVWQFLIENIILTLFGGLIAVALSFIVMELLGPTGVVPSHVCWLNLRILFMGLIFCLIFGFVSGFLPALRMARMQIVESLNEGE